LEILAYCFIISQIASQYIPLSGSSFTQLTDAFEAPTDPDCYDVEYHEGSSETLFYFGGSGCD